MSKFTDESVMPFGKFKGYDLGRVPAKYLLWLQAKILERDHKSLQDKELLLYINKNQGLLKQEAAGIGNLRNN